MRFNFTLYVLFSVVATIALGQTVMAQLRPFKGNGSSILDSLVTDRIRQLSALAGISIDSPGLFNHPSRSILEHVKTLKPAISLQLPADTIVKKQPLLAWRGGYVNYQWNYRSNIDTPFQERDIAQHFLNINADFTITGWLPIRTTLFHRSSNSALFRDFTDFRIEYDAYTMQQWQVAKLIGLRNQVISKLENPIPDLQAKLKKQQTLEIKDFLDRSDIRTQYINAKELVQNPGLANQSPPVKDSILRWATSLVNVYDQLDSCKATYARQFDSLIEVVNENKARLAEVRKTLEGNGNTEASIRRLKAYMREKGFSESDLRSINNPLSGIRSLAIGRTLPQYSPLTVSNVNVRGLHLEYAKNGRYAAVTAGLIDFRVRDFIYAGTRRPPQFMAATKLGLGLPESKHVFVSVFGGKKQLLPTMTSNSAFPLLGVSLELQYVIAKYHRLTAEIAQSKTETSFAYPDTLLKSGGLDKHSRAFRLQWRTYLPATRTTLNAMYVHQGVNFQSFTSVRSNAELNRWNLTFDQKLFKNLLTLVGSLQKNDFSNPYVIQRYNANTVYKTAGVTLRKPKWPSVQVSYAPGSQMSVIDSIVYENRFQTLNANASYPFAIGTAKANTVIAYSKFYNNSQDSGFVYYNASNLFFTQDLTFRSMRLNWGFSIMNNGWIHYSVMEAGAQFAVWKRSVVNGGVKINKLGLESTQLGFYINTRVSDPKVGELSIWMEQNYLPGTNQSLVRNAFFNIGFTRYFTSNRKHS